MLRIRSIHSLMRLPRLSLRRELPRLDRVKQYNTMLQGSFGRVVSSVEFIKSWRVLSLKGSGRGAGPATPAGGGALEVPRALAHWRWCWCHFTLYTCGCGRGYGKI